MAKVSSAKKQSTTFPAGNSATNTDSLQPHALADSVPGDMSDDEYSALCKSIKEHGLRNPVVLFDGKILDGRARYRACRKTGVELKTIEFKGTAQEAEAYVLDNNLHRRQLNSMQKALVAARMCEREGSPITQADAAAMVGVGVATVNLAVRLLKSKNAPLIKRCEKGEATRGEIDEILFDRAASQQQARVAATAGAHAAPASGNGNPDPGDEEEEEEDDDLVGNMPSKGGEGKSSNVIPLRSGSGVVGNKASHPERRSRETPASKVVSAFRALEPSDRKHFVDMAWQWLEPALKAAGRYAATGGNVTKIDKKAEAKGKQTVAKGKQAVTPKKRKAA